MGKLLVRGMLAGLLAAVFAFAFASVFGEPQVDNAIAVEESAAPHEHGASEEELVSRGTQSTVGLATAVGAYGLAFGGMFALAFAFAYGRIGNLSARATAGVLAVGAFLVVFLVPYLKYPANPPAVGNPDTINERTTLYFVTVLISLVVAVLAIVLARRLTDRLGSWNAILLGALGYVVVMAVVALLLPRINEVPEGFPASLLWNFRLASLGTQLVLWTAIGLIFGVFTERRVRRVAATRPL
ncbi:putative cobalt transporter CbtA [Kibdelosporangium banguiense]|uniref:Cobalt transporter CbtA n=1 Tax=Kibdelosporangium banguiense TaxID=1365924 RepID=A0ABS4TN67_9PSEU|nr:CbtA family protein [Kibdelosporangium banguiense]MBP2325434.1 putative cobalt transporter CbtA [Kibdelosporangium banguiense]